MKVKRHREIVIEYERIQLIRKRAITERAHCHDCGHEADFVTLPDAADIFGTTETDLFHFLQINNCHYRVSNETKTQLCLVSLLACMKTKTLNQQIKMIGESGK